MKKLISFLCVAAMLLSILPCAFADGEGITVPEGVTLVLPNAGDELTLSVDGGIVNNGTVKVDGTLTNDGRASVSIDGDVTNDGAILEENANGSDQIYIRGNLTNTGSIVADNENNAGFDAVHATGSVQNSGEIVINGQIRSGGFMTPGAFVNTETGVITSAGIYAGPGGTVTNDGEINGGVYANGGSVANGGTINGSVVAANIENLGVIYCDHIGADTLYNDGLIVAVGGVDAGEINNYDTIVVNDGEGMSAFYAVAKTEDGNLVLLSIDENGGLGVKKGDEVTVNLENDGRDVLDSAWEFEGWQILGDNGDVMVVGDGETTFTVNSRTLISALWKYIEKMEKMGWFVDDQVSKVMDAEGNELVLGQDYYHVAFTSYNRYIVVFTNEQLQAMESGNHTFTIVLNDGTECTYTLGVE